MFDHILTKAVSVPIGCNDHNMVYPRKPKFQKLGLKLCIRDHTNDFAATLLWMKLKNICWSYVINKEHPDAALDEFMKLLLLLLSN